MVEFFSFCVNASSIHHQAIKGNVLYKQLFPPPLQVPSYLSCETQICVVNGHAQYKQAWPSPASSFDYFFSILQGHKIKLLGILEPHWSSCRTLLKNILWSKLFPDVKKMLVMEIICWVQTPPPVCQLPQGLVTLYRHTLTLHPTACNLWCRPFCFPRCLIFCTEHSFVSCTPLLSVAPFFVLAVVLSFKQTLSELAGFLRPSPVHCTLFSIPNLT